jgi:signal transduction histidine kinase
LMTSIRSRCDRMIRDADARFAIRQEALIRSGSDVRMLVPAVGILGVIALVFAAQQAWVRARAQVVVAQLREEASRAGRWFDMIAHDLRTPLNSISLNLQLAAMSLPGGIAPSIRQVGEAIVEAEKDAKVMAEQIGGFLDIARAQVGKVCLSRFAIGDIVEDACRSVRTAADLKGLCFTVSTSPELTLCSDPGRVRRIVVNLVDNAVKFTEFGAVSVSASARRGGAEICIRDTGPGIAPDLIPRLFGDFQQGGNVERQAEKGFGLGLATCRRLADRIGVEFAVESAPGEGTTFTVSVPDLGDASSSRGRASAGLHARIAGVWSRLRSCWS